MGKSKKPIIEEMTDWLAHNKSYINVRNIEKAIGGYNGSLTNAIKTTPKPMPEKWALKLKDFINNNLKVK
jgi:hypothetical protein